MFSNEDRVCYGHNQIVNVVCRLQFPTILSISAQEPFEFQDAVRREFPRYQRKNEQPAPKLVNQSGVLSAQRQAPVLNHTFVAADGSMTLSLTNSAIALSAGSYSDWETFAHKLDWVLSEFFRIYQPAYFESIGLRYINGFSKQELGLEDLRWGDLLQPAYAGLMREEDVRDEDFSRCTQDAEFRVRGGCRAKIHTGPGRIKRDGQQEKEPRLIFDLDVVMLGQIQLPHVTGALQTVHQNADSLFRGAITEELHNAMEPR